MPRRLHRCRGRRATPSGVPCSDRLRSADACRPGGESWRQGHRRRPPPRECVYACRLRRCTVHRQSSSDHRSCARRCGTYLLFRSVRWRAWSDRAGGLGTVMGRFVPLPLLGRLPDPIKPHLGPSAARPSADRSTQGQSTGHSIRRRVRPARAQQHPHAHSHTRSLPDGAMESITPADRGIVCRRRSWCTGTRERSPRCTNTRTTLPAGVSANRWSRWSRAGRTHSTDLAHEFEPTAQSISNRGCSSSRSRYRSAGPTASRRPQRAELTQLRRLRIAS